MFAQWPNTDVILNNLTLEQITSERYWTKHLLPKVSEYRCLGIHCNYQHDLEHFATAYCLDGASFRNFGSQFSHISYDVGLGLGFSTKRKLPKLFSGSLLQYRIDHDEIPLTDFYFVATIDSKDSHSFWEGFFLPNPIPQNWHK
jgi:hypothetical protein